MEKHKTLIALILLFSAIVGCTLSKKFIEGKEKTNTVVKIVEKSPSSIIKTVFIHDTIYKEKIVTNEKIVIKKIIDTTLVDSLNKQICLYQDSLKNQKKPTFNIGFKKDKDTLFVQTAASAKILALQKENKDLKNHPKIYYKLIPYEKQIKISLESLIYGIVGALVFAATMGLIIHHNLKKKFFNQI